MRLVSIIAIVLVTIIHRSQPEAVPLIIDTDASFDVDDVVAICMAHALMDRGEVEIKAIVHDAGIPEGIGAISVLNTFYGRENIPLGAYKGAFGRTPNGDDWVRGWYVDDLVDNYPSPVKDSREVPDAVETYRMVLSSAEDKSIVISSIGFVTNIAALLRSEPDNYSELNGYDLVAAKVKTIVWQDGIHQCIDLEERPTIGIVVVGSMTRMVAMGKLGMLLTICHRLLRWFIVTLEMKSILEVVFLNVRERRILVDKQ